MARSFFGRHGPADSMVGETEPGHASGVEYVAAVENHRLTHQPAHHLEIRVAKLVPLGDDDERISLLERAVGAIAVDEPVTVNCANIGERLRVVNPRRARRRSAASRSRPGLEPRERRRFAV